MSKCMVHKNLDTDEYYFLLEEVLAGTNVNVTDVGYYELNTRNGRLVLTIYDKDKNPIDVKEKK